MIREEFTYRAECDHGPISSYEFGQFCTDRGDLIHLLALPDMICKVRPVRKEFERFKKMQRRQI